MPCRNRWNCLGGTLANFNVDPAGPAGPKCKPTAHTNTSHSITSRVWIPRKGVAWGTKPKCFRTGRAGSTLNKSLGTTDLEGSNFGFYRAVCVFGNPLLCTWARPARPGRSANQRQPQHITFYNFFCLQPMETDSLGDQFEVLPVRSGRVHFEQVRGQYRSGGFRLRHL